MRVLVLLLSAALLNLAGTASAAPITLAADPFDWSTALTTPGRHIVGGELFSPIDTANDDSLIDRTVLGVSTTVSGADDVPHNSQGRDATPTIAASNSVLAAVPEPATLALLGSGALVLGKIMRRRRRRKLTLRYLR